MCHGIVLASAPAYLEHRYNLFRGHGSSVVCEHLTEYQSSAIALPVLAFLVPCQDRFYITNDFVPLF